MSGKAFAESYPSGIKWTKQRKDVYHILIETGEPLSAQEIYNRILQRGQTGYAVSTIYRILTAFEEKNMVLKSTLIGEDTALYMWNRGEHLHYAICLNCRKRIPLKVCPMKHVKIEEEAFTVTGHRVEIYGYCNGCAEQKNTNPRALTSPKSVPGCAFRDSNPGQID